MELDINADSYRNLSERLQGLHERLFDVAPDIDLSAVRVQCSSELVRIFGLSVQGDALQNYVNKASTTALLIRKPPPNSA